MQHVTEACAAGTDRGEVVDFFHEPLGSGVGTAFQEAACLGIFAFIHQITRFFDFIACHKVPRCFALLL
jgi:hypothetical protein